MTGEITIRKSYILAAAGILLLLVAANIYTCIGKRTSPTKKEYKQSLQVNDQAIKQEQEFRIKIEQHIKQSEEKLRAYQVRDSVLANDQKRLEIRLNQIQNSYEKINGRYRDATNDSIRSLFTK
jgi:uncharacterized membrane protein YhiD involved in acid resistance